MTERYGRYLYECVFAIPLSIATLLLCYEDVGLEKAGFFPCAYAVLYCIACAFLVYLKGKDRLLAAGLITVFLVLPAAYGLITDEKNYYDGHLYIWLIPAICAGFFLAGLLCKHLRLFRYLAAIGVIATLVALLVLDFRVPKLCVMLFLSVLILLIADETQTLWRKEGRTDHALHLTFVAPFVFLWLLFCLMFPVSRKPYDWNIVKTLWNRINDLSISFSQWSGGKKDDFSSYLPGFSEGSKVGGGRVNDSSKVLLQVESIMGNAPSLRLAGEACDTFDDLEWSATIRDNTRELEFDAIETRCALEKAGSFSDYMQSVEVRVTYRKFSSRHLFVPDKVIIRGTSLAALGADEQGRNLLYAKKKGLNNQYVVSGYRVNLLHSAFSELVNHAEPITADDWKTVTQRSDVSAYAADYKNFLAYRESLKTLYVKPVTLSNGAKDFVTQATEGAETPFDRMLMIGKALNSFDYSTSPGRFPSSVKDASTFLDHFLASRRGYCTHFATAMVLFAWSEGLPARYVHGFSIPLNGNPAAAVDGNMAHAWCEIYFENIGWIPFDITPGFNNDAYWATSGERNDRIWDSDDPKPTPSPFTPPEEEKNAPVPVLKILILVLIAIGFLFVFTVIVLLSDRAITLRRFSRLSDAERIPVWNRRNRRILSYLGLPMRKEETLTDYRNRIITSLPDKTVAWIPSYEEFLYGSPSDIAKIEESMKAGNKALIKEFRKRHPKKYRLCALGNRLIR
ncbi:MAG: transglutaminase domain-containing protein [Lachnospiraceae bacterium]|nr:transglutaminase domain-containing protein [Lachnospiraceae bacterium]